jgi:hypothetical protein
VICNRVRGNPRTEEVPELADQPTCGQGLAGRSTLPTKLGELSASLADNLEVHTSALDLSDENAKQEHAVYLRLIETHRAIAAQLEALGEEMAGYRNLPMGKHDPDAMSSPEVAAAFDRYVNVERELLAQLQERVEEDQHILADMRASGEA